MSASRAKLPLCVCKRDRKLMTDLERANPRLASQQQQLRSSTAADDQEATKREYLSLQAANAAPNEQLKGDRR